MLASDPQLFWAALEALATVAAAVGTVAAFVAVAVQIYRDAANRRSDDALRQARRVSAWIGGSLRLEAAPPYPLDERKPDEMPLELTAATILNASGEPVYRVAVWLVVKGNLVGWTPAGGSGAYLEDEEPKEQTAGYDEEESMPSYQPQPLPIVIAVLPPGAWVVPLPGGWQGMHAYPLVECAFTDAAERHWRRRSNGALVRLKKGALEYYLVPQPLPWYYPTPSDVTAG